MANKLNVALVAALAVAGFVLLKSHDARVRADALADARRDSVVTALAVTDSILSAYNRMDSAYSRELIALQDSIATVPPPISRTYVDSVMVTVTDTVVRRIVDTLRAEADACNDALGTCNRVSALWKERYTSCNDALGVCKSDRASLATTYLEVHRPNLWDRFTTSLPFVGAAVLLTLVISR